MFCFTVLSSFTLFTWRKLKVHYWRKEVWEWRLWSGGRQLGGQNSPQREVLGLSPWPQGLAGHRGGASSRLAVWGSPRTQVLERAGVAGWRRALRAASPDDEGVWQWGEGRRSSPHGRAAARGQEKMLGPTSEDGCDPTLPINPAQLGLAPLCPAGGSCLA